jgi:hypothetical protein
MMIMPDTRLQTKEYGRESRLSFKNIAERTATLGKDEAMEFATSGP